MKRSALTYTALAAIAITAGVAIMANLGTGAGAMDASASRSMDASTLTGDMRKFVVHPQPKPAGTTEFLTIDGDPLTLAEYKGKWALVNFWATWCAPCKKEMPMLDALQAEMGGDDFEVVTIGTRRSPAPLMREFFEEVGIQNLPLHQDPQSPLAREMGLAALPTTVLLNPEGQEVARLMGDADWASEDARTLITSLLQPEAD